MRFSNFFLLATAFVCSATEALTFEKEKMATRTLFEQTDQYTHLHQGEAESRRLKYVQRVRDDIQKLKTQHVSYDALPKIRADIEESYQSLFENYIVQNVPYKGKLLGNSSTATAMFRAVSACMQQQQTGKNHPVTEDFPLRDCVNADELRDVVQVPAVAYNSYNVRLGLAAPPEGSGGSSSVDMASHWPSLLQVPTSLTIPLSRAAPRSCPADMHMLLWGPSAHLTARLFSRERASHALSPSPGNDLLHNVQFRAPSEQLEGLSADTTLMAGGDDYLFVPHDHLVSLAQHEGHDDAPPATVFLMCFFDASNVNFVRESLGVSALILDPLSLEALSLLQSSGAGRFDFNMTRKAPGAALSYRVYATYPRGAEGVGDGGDAKSKSKPRGRDRSKGGANNFRGKE